jgi:hypothetical protein
LIAPNGIVQMHHAGKGPAVQVLEALNVATYQCSLDDREALPKAADGVGVVSLIM